MFLLMTMVIYQLTSELDLACKDDSIHYVIGFGIDTL